MHRMHLIWITALAVVGCGTAPGNQAQGTDPATTARPATTWSAGADGVAPTGTFDGPTCLRMAQTVEALTSATDPAATAELIETLRGYGAPDDVLEASRAMAAEGDNEAMRAVFRWLTTACP